MGLAATLGVPILRTLGNAILGSKKDKAEQERLRLQLEQQMKIAEMEDRTTRDLANQRTATEESMANPFRHLADQASTAARLDAMNRATWSPAQVSGGSSRYAGNMPTISGGFNYQSWPRPAVRLIPPRDFRLARRVAQAVSMCLSWKQTTTCWASVP